MACHVAGPEPRLILTVLFSHRKLINNPNPIIFRANMNNDYIAGC